MIRAHLSPNEVINLSCHYKQAATGSDNALKPNGLWYDINRSWLEWCRNNDMHEFIHRHVHKIEFIDDLPRPLLVIDTQTKLRLFMSNYQVGDGITAIQWIDWQGVSETYCGIELRNYHSLKRYIDRRYGDFSLLPLWFFAWDCDSGCLFTSTVIKSQTTPECS